MIKKEFFKFRLVEDEVCIFCFLLDFIEYIFLYCIVIIVFYLKVILWFNYENDIDIIFLSK